MMPNKFSQTLYMILEILGFQLFIELHSVTFGLYFLPSLMSRPRSIFSDWNLFYRFFPLLFYSTTRNRL